MTPDKPTVLVDRPLPDVGGRFVVLFDGVCNLCDASVQFIIRHDHAERFVFCALQSPIGKRYLEHFGMLTDDFDTFVLVEHGQAHTQSAAALKVLRILGGWWILGYGLIVVPRLFRDWLYRIVVRNRYRLFGKKDQCMVPTGALRGRFLED